MKPHSIGRTLGIGVRIAGRVVGQRVVESAQAATQSATQTATGAATRAVPAAPGVPSSGTPAGAAAQRIAAAVPTKAGIGRGVAGFLRPFQRVGGKIGLEVAGVFFLLFVVVFAPTLWRARASYAHGPDHRTFVASAIVVVVFLYLSVSSFWRARKR